jgi:hypothetical protein
MSAEPTPPNPIVDLLLTIILPSAALEWLSKPSRLGPFWALVVALMLPLGFGVYCYVTRGGLNFFSVLGLVAVMLTGGLGLLKLDAFWFAIKEASVPIFLGLAFPLSHRWGKPLIESILLTPQLINRPLLEKSIISPDQRTDFSKLLFKASLGMGSGMALSAIGNFLLAMFLLGGKEPGSEAFVKAIGKLNWAGFLVIGVPLCAVMFLVLTGFLKGVTRITGLEQDDLMNPGKTVRRTVDNRN